MLSGQVIAEVIRRAYAADMTPEGEKYLRWVAAQVGTRVFGEEVIVFEGLKSLPELAEAINLKHANVRAHLRNGAAEAAGRAPPTVS